MGYNAKHSVRCVRDGAEYVPHHSVSSHRWSVLSIKMKLEVSFYFSSLVGECVDTDSSVKTEIFNS